MKRKFLLIISCMAIAASAFIAAATLGSNFPSKDLTSAAAYYEAMQNNLPKSRDDVANLIDSLSKLDASAYINDECIIFAESERKAQQVADKLNCTLVCWSESTHNALLKINDERTLPDLLNEIAESDKIDYSAVPTPNYIYTATKETAVSGTDAPKVTDVGDYDNISDEFFSQKTDITYEKVHLAWSGATGKGVTVAVIDTGVDYDHPDLVNKISSLSVRINNGSVSNMPSEYNDLHGHGTHVCGTIAAEGNNKLGVIGVAPESELISIKATTTSNGTDFSYYNLIESIFYAVDCEADIINLSLGAAYSTGNNTELETAINFAESSGVVIVAAAGNAAEYHANYPAAYDNVIAVSSVNSSGTFSSWFSNYGPEIDFAAVGQNVYSTAKDGEYCYKSGTSMAAPNVSGAVALILSVYPDASLSEIRSMLKTNALDLGAEGYDDYFGYGVIQMDFLAKKLTSGNYNYIVLDDGTVKITSCVDATTNLEIPAQIDGKAVTEIAANAFYNQTSLQSVSIPSSVTKIGNGAFDGCSNLSKVTVDSPAVSYGNGVFGENTSFKMFCNYGSDTGAYCDKNGIDYYYKDLTATGIQLDKADVDVEFSQSISVTASTIPARVYGEFTWKSEDESIATVNNGVICGVAPGTTKITVTMGDFSAECTVTVKISATSLTLDKSSATISTKETVQLLATVAPSNTTDVVKWTSADSSIAKVDSNGLVTGISSGTTTITATVGNISAACEIEVLQKAEKISLDRNSISLGKTDSATLTATVTPSNAVGTVKWSSSNTDIAVVTADGTVTAVGHGTAVITAEIDGVKDTCTVTCKPDLTIKMLGGSIRLSDPYGLRFGIQLTKDAEYEMTDIVEYGTIMLPSQMLGDDEQLTLSTENIRKITATNILSETSSAIVYTGVLINIPVSGFNSEITGRGYLIYKDADGTQHTIYSDTAVRSLYMVAQLSYDQYSNLANPTDDEKSLIERLENIMNLADTASTTATTSTSDDSDESTTTTTV